MGCGQRPINNLPASAIAEICDDNRKEMKSQIVSADLWSESVGERLGKCEICMGCTPRGYCSRLLQMPELQDCQARWDAWCDLLLNGGCPGFTDSSFWRAQSRESRGEEMAATIPSDVGLYWAVVQFPRQVGSQVPVASVVKARQEAIGTQAPPAKVEAPTDYNALLALGCGRKPPFMQLAAMPISEVLNARVPKWTPIEPDAIVTVGPKIDAPPLARSL